MRLVKKKNKKTNETNMAEEEGNAGWIDETPAPALEEKVSFPSLPLPFLFNTHHTL